MDELITKNQAVETTFDLRFKQIQASRRAALARKEDHQGAPDHRKLDWTLLTECRSRLKGDRSSTEINWNPTSEKAICNLLISSRIYFRLQKLTYRYTKTMIKMYLIENKEVALLVKLNR